MQEKAGDQIQKKEVNEARSKPHTNLGLHQSHRHHVAGML